MNYKKTKLLGLITIISIACIMATSCKINVSRKTDSKSPEKTVSVSPSLLPSPSPSQSQIDKTKVSPEDIDGKLKLYKNAQYGFSFKHHEKWKISEDAGGSAVCVMQPLQDSEDDFCEYFSILKPSKTSYTENDLGLVAETLIDAQMKVNATTVVISTEEMKVSKNRARKFVYISTINGKKLKAMEVITIKKGYLYLTSFTSTDVNYDASKVYANEIYSSLEIDSIQ